MTNPVIRRFEAERGRLRAVAFRMLGSAAEADDAVQEAWLRLHSAEAAEIGNLRAWLTTVVSRIALDMLRTRKARGEEELAPQVIEPVADRSRCADPEQEALLAEAVGIGMLIVLDQLEPPERLAFVLHDFFGVGFDDIAPIVGRSTVAARQLASRARRRVRGFKDDAVPNVMEQRRVVEAFFSASREGDFAALLKLLDPNATMRIDAESGSGLSAITTGAAAIAKRAQLGASARGKWSDLMLVDGSVSIVVAPLGHIHLVMRFEVADELIRQIEIVTDRHRLNRFQIALLDDRHGEGVVHMAPGSSR